MTNIKKSEEEIKRNINNYLIEIQPYIKMMVEIHSRKPLRLILNTKTGETKFDHGNLSPMELEIKNHLQYLKEKYMGS